MDDEDIAIGVGIGILAGIVGVLWYKLHRVNKLIDKVCDMVDNVLDNTDRALDIVLQAEVDQKFEEIVEHYDD